MVDYIIEEAVGQLSGESGDAGTTSRVSAAINNRIDLLVSCICDDDTRVRLIVDHAEKALSKKR